jgi:hypothetical protein
MVSALHETGLKSIQLICGAARRRNSDPPAERRGDPPLLLIGRVLSVRFLGYHFRPVTFDRFRLL